MISKRSTFHLKILEFRNLKTIKAKKAFIHFSELNDKRSTIKRIPTKHFPKEYSITTFSSKYNGIVLTLTYMKNEEKELFLDEFVIPFEMVPFKQTVKFVLIIKPPISKPIEENQYPVFTFLVYDNPMNVEADTGLLTSVSVNQPFESAPVPVDQILYDKESAKTSFKDCIIFYKRKRDDLFPLAKNLPVLPDINLSDKETINKAFERISTIEKDKDRISSEENDTISLYLMKNEEIFNIKGLVDTRIDSIQAGEEPSDICPRPIKYFFDFNYT